MKINKQNKNGKNVSIIYGKNDSININIFNNEILMEIVGSFDSNLKEGLTFDDVLLVPAYSEVLPGEVSVGTLFSKNINLSIPIISAAMDTISESQKAIALAREGCISVIHKNMPIQDQAKQINLVKRSESGIILEPIS